MVLIEVRDDGPNHPEPPRRTSGGSGLGLQIIETLVKDDLGGSFYLGRDTEWVRAQVAFSQRRAMSDDE
ncbi:MAG: hypothetical protein HC914_18210 [Chloroflexaceae bacterium]|nr:hypothetical protein [Chloroflexaceae bacterium]